MYCECGKPSENVREGGPCASCKHAARKADRMANKPKKVYHIPKAVKPIPKISPKMARAMSEFSRIKKPWIKGKRCAVFPELPATQVHHKRGKGFGFWDDWARERGIILLNDVRWWLAVSDKGHRKITDQSAWAVKMGFTLSRTEKV